MIDHDDNTPSEGHARHDRSRGFVADWVRQSFNIFLHLNSFHFSAEENYALLKRLTL